MQNATIAHFAGIDVAQASFVVALRPSGERRSFRYTSHGVRDAADHLEALRPKLVVLEATGGLERRLAAGLATRGLPIAIVNPRRTRNFALALDQLAKTDSIDADVIAHFAESVRPQPRPLPDAAALERDALRTRRRQVAQMLAVERNHLASAPECVRELVERQIAHLAELVRQTDALLRASILANERLRERDAVLRTAKGIGEVTSAMLIALLPELGQLSNKQIARLVGVAPLNDDSGEREGRRTCKGGRADVRTALYLPTLTATKHNPAVRPFYDRLIARGKPTKVALIAAMRKLLIILNAMVRDNCSFSHRPPLCA